MTEIWIMYSIVVRISVALLPALSVADKKVQVKVIEKSLSRRPHRRRTRHCRTDAVNKNRKANAAEKKNKIYKQ